MLFNSYAFIFIFLPITFLGMLWLGARTERGAVLWLSLASIVFYGYWNPAFVSLLFGTALFNYGASRWLEARYAAKTTGNTNYLLIIAITINLLVLGYFKYTNFFVGALINSVGGNFQPLNIILPLGISFFTFTQIAFLIDVSRGFAHEHNFSRYLLFVTYFPHLIAGPLLHHKQMMPQFANPSNLRFNRENVNIGLTIFVLGLAKKIFLADSLGEIANPVFDVHAPIHPLQFVEAWTGALSYTLQLYFDFSAYSDMAVGLSMIFNIRLPLNFNSPYKATSVIEFWQRWHMSLTKYIGEYLYTPLSIKLMRHGLGKPFLIETLYTLVLPTLATFFIIGLWHGASWTFVMFGVIHGVYLIINHWWRVLKKKLGVAKHTGRLSILGSRVMTYLAVVVALVFFRADTVGSAFDVCRGMAGMNGISLPATLEPLFAIFSLHAEHVGLSFEGVFPNKLFSYPNWYIFVLLVVGHFVVWCLPNMHQIMFHYKVVCEDLATRPKIKRQASLGRLSWMIWTPSPRWGILIGLLFFTIVLAMASHKPATFLYYQF